MTRIPTSNCVLTTDRDTLEKYISTGGNLKDMENEMATKSAFFFSSEGNSNFINFSASWNKNNSLITFTLLDPNNEFDAAFVQAGVLDSEAGASVGLNTALELTDQDIIDLGLSSEGYGIGTTSQAVIKDLKNSFSNINKGISEKFKEKRKIEANPSLAIFRPGPLSSLPDPSKPVFNKEESPVFVGFGVGNNMKFWQGPIQGVIKTYEVDLSKGRVLTLGITPTANTRENIGKDSGALAGRTAKIEGKSRPIKLSNVLSSGEFVYSAFRQDPKGKKTKKVFDEFSEFLDEQELSNNQVVERLTDSTVDFHYLIVDCIKDLLRKMYNMTNVIVLLPDLSKYCSKALFDSFKDTLSTSATAKSLLGSFTFNKVKTGIPTPTALAFQIAGRAGNFTATQLPLLDKAGNLERSIKSFLGKVGMNLASIKETYALGETVTDAFSMGILENKLSLEDAPSAPDAVAKYFTDREFRAQFTVSEEGKNPDGEKVIRQLLDNLESASNGEYKIKLAYNQENNINILKVFDQFKSTESAGFFSSKDIINPLFDSNFSKDEPCIIFGHEPFVRNFLYSRSSTGEGAELLHPADREVLGSKRYRNAIRQARKTPIDRSSFVDTLYITPAQFSNSISKANQISASEPTSASEKLKNLASVAAFTVQNDDISEVGEPPEDKIEVFRYNDQNPNVLSFKYTQSKEFIGALNVGVAKAIDKRSSITAKGFFPPGHSTFEARTKAAQLKREIIREKATDSILASSEGFTDLFNSILKASFARNPKRAKRLLEAATASTPLEGKLTDVINYDGSKDLSKETVRLLQENSFFFEGIVTQLTNVPDGPVTNLFEINEYGSPEEEANLKAFKKELSNFKNSQRLLRNLETAPLIEIPQESPETPLDVINSIAESLKTMTSQISITTLPFFHIYGTKDDAKPCYFFASDPPVIGSDLSTRSKINNFLSGPYKIIQMYHNIEARGKAYSEFTLVRENL